MKERSYGFLRNEIISHDSEQFDYISELNEYLWRFIRSVEPGASGKISDYLDKAVEKLEGSGSVAQGVQQGTVNELAAWLAALEDAYSHEPVSDSLIQHGRAYIRAGLTEKHSGDCTNECHSCVVCGTTDYLAKAKQILNALSLSSTEGK